MRDLRKNFIEILKAEVKPAVGCTEPVAVSLAGAKAAEVLGEEVKSAKVQVSPNIFKNGMGVGIPGTDRIGLKVAAAIGICGGKSSDGLSLLENISEENIKKAENMVDRGIIDVEPANTEDKVFIDIKLQGENNNVHVIIRNKHDNFTYIKSGGQVLLSHEKTNNNQKNGKRKDSIFDDISLEEIIRNVEAIEARDIKFLLEGLEMNEKMAMEGLKDKIGIGVGYGIKKSIDEGIMGDDLVTLAMMMTAAASDARMAGVNMPVMSSNGSGNHGLTAILPIAAYLDKFPQDEEKAVKALAISHLVTAYIKNFTGRLSAMCGCGVAASTGSSAGLAWLMGQDIRQIEGTVKNMIADMSGMICDGAKAGCAIKLSSAASAAVQNAILSSNNCIVDENNGIVSQSVDESIRNLGRVSEFGMAPTDKVILDVMNEINK